MITIITKIFEELSVKQLYYILQLRSEVFVVEQDCVYLDIDGKDPKALHVIGYKNNKIVAYTRIFKAGDYFDTASIGRVVVSKSERYNKYGYAIMKSSIHTIISLYPGATITLSAQMYLKQFYTNLGFKAQGSDYLEDGIPHILMIRN